jgi:hypothetical protein
LVAWIKSLQKAKVSVLQSQIAKRSARFMALPSVRARLDDPVASRAAQKFAFLYAALSMGRQVGIVPWPRAWIEDAVSATFGRTCRGLAALSPVALVDELSRLLRDPTRCPDARNLKATEKDARPLPTRWLGVRGLAFNGKHYIGLHPAGLAAQWGPISSERLIEELVACGHMKKQAGSELWQTRVPNHGRPRLYRLSSKILSGAGRSARA